MFGLGFGGLVIYLLADSFHLHLRRNLQLLSLTLAISIVFNLWSVLSSHFSSAVNWYQLIPFLFLYVTCTIPFVLCGMIVSILFLNKAQNSYMIYGADLLGAAAGCIACIVLITYLSAQQVVLIASLLCVMAAYLFNIKKFPRYEILLAIGILLLIVFANFLFPVVKTKTYSELNAHKIYEKWSPLSRITVFPKVFTLNTKIGEPFGWGMSDVYQPQGYFKQLWLEQDAHAGTPIVFFEGDYKKVEYLKYDITALPYYLRKDASVFIIGVGGGRDVLTALLFNSKIITGVDIHPIIVSLVKEKFADYAGHIYSHPKVNIAVGEGRSVLKKSNNTYDIIQIPLVDSWAATVAGAFAMSENSLYTQEAFTTYLNHLNPNGLLSVSRFYFTPENETLKVAILARAALEGIGERAANHIVILKSKPRLKAAIATTLVKRTPFSTAELEQISAHSRQLNFDIVYMPHNAKNNPLFQKAITTNRLNEFLNSYYYDVRPTMDDRPFFFQMFYMSNVLDLFKGTKLSGQAFNFYSLGVFLVLLFISIILLLVFFFFPLFVSKKTSKISLGWGFYFTLLGLGFMLIEIPVIQLGALYLEGTTYGLSVALFSLLFFGGIGCIIAQSLTKHLFKILPVALLIILAVTIAYPAYFKVIMENTFSFVWGIKLLLFVVILIPLAICMGMALPTGIKIVKETKPVMVNAIPWYWALNGGASVIGSIIAMASAMELGYSMTLYIAAFTYFGALLVFYFLQVRKMM